MPSLREHYIKAAMCLLEDGVQDCRLLDIYHEASSIWKSSSSEPFPETYDDFFDRDVKNLNNYLSEALHRYMYAGLEGPGIHIDTVVSPSGKLQTRIRSVSYADDSISINEQIHSDLRFNLSLDGSSGLKLTPSSN